MLYILFIQLFALGNSMMLKMDQQLITADLSKLSGAALKQAKSNAGVDGYLKVAALGRPFQLGHLYDAWTDNLIIGTKPWSEEKIKSYTRIENITHTTFDYIEGETLTDRSRLMDLNAHVAASALWGLIPLYEETAHILSKSVVSNYEATVTYAFKRSTRHEVMELARLQALENAYVFNDNPTATHVVAEVKYGNNAFLKFIQKIHSAAEKRSVEGNLLLPALKALENAFGGKELHISEEEKRNYSHITCDFVGDIKPDKYPTNFTEAKELVKKLPILMKAVKPIVLEVSLLPVKVFNDKLNRLVIQLNQGISNDMMTMANKYDAMKRNIGDLTVQSTYWALPQYKKQVDEFKEAFTFKHKRIKNKMKELLPKLRHEGDQEKLREELENILDERDTRYTLEKVENWVNSHKRESSAFSSLIEGKISKMVVTDAEFQGIVYDHNVNYIVALVIRLYSDDDQFTHCLLNHCEKDTSSVNCDKYKCSDSIKLDSWLHRSGIQSKLHHRMKEFIQFIDNDKKTNGVSAGDSKKTRVVVKPEVYKENSPPVNLVIYENGELFVDDFTLPTVTDINFNENDECTDTTVTWKINMDNMDERAKSLVQGFSVKYFLHDTPDGVNIDPVKIDLNDGKYVVEKLGHDFTIIIEVRCKFGICHSHREPFEGSKKCKKYRNICKRNGCKHGGNCQVKGEDVLCICINGWTGIRCDQRPGSICASKLNYHHQFSQNQSYIILNNYAKPNYQHDALEARADDVFHAYNRERQANLRWGVIGSEDFGNAYFLVSLDSKKVLENLTNTIQKWMDFSMYEWEFSTERIIINNGV